MYTVTKDGQTMQLHDGVQLAAFVKSGWAKEGTGTIDRYEQPYQTLPAAEQYAPSPSPEPYTQEHLEQMERKDLFAIADSYSIEYASNIPTARLIDQILAYQTAR